MLSLTANSTISSESDEQRQLAPLGEAQLRDGIGELWGEPGLERVIEAVERLQVVPVVLEREAQVQEADGALGLLMVWTGLGLQSL